MVNTQSGPRLLNQSLTMHSTDRHKTPFFDNLNTNSFGYGGDPYAGTFLRMDKGRAYKLDGSFLRNRQYFNSNLFGNSLIPDNAVPYVPILDSPHLFNTVRKTGDVNLTVLPLSRVSGRAAFWRTVNEGPSFSSNVSKSNSNPLLDQWWRYSNDIYSGGLDWKLAKRTVLSYDQFVTSFKQDTTWNLSKFEYQLADGTPASQGLNIFTTAKNTCLVSGTENTIINKCNGTLAYHRYEPVRTLLATEQIRFTSASIPHVSMNGRFLYSDGQLNMNHYDEGYSGWSDSSINTTGRNIIRYSGVGENSHLGTLPRINVSADYGITELRTRSIRQHLRLPLVPRQRCHAAVPGDAVRHQPGQYVQLLQSSAVPASIHGQHLPASHQEHSRRYHAGSPPGVFRTGIHNQLDHRVLFTD
jgi:hypothetical protein